VETSTMYPRESWVFNGTNQAIDNGYMISIDYDPSSLDGVTFEGIEVNV
jgi:hypothetical protein